MKARTNFPLTMVLMVLLASACSSSQHATTVRDDVYFLPSMAPVEPLAQAQPEPAPPSGSDDYYDAGTSKELGADQDYYDLTYNDPHYYNYGRFGFDAAPGWQTGWNGPGWGMGMGMGMGIGMGMGMGYGWNNGFGYGMGYPYNNNFYSPYGFNNGWNSFNSLGYGYGNGYGYGSYYGPGGLCYSCYSPVSIDSGRRSGPVSRPNMGSGGGSYSEGTRYNTRNPVGLAPYSGVDLNSTGPTRSTKINGNGITPTRDHRSSDTQRRSGTRQMVNTTREPSNTRSMDSGTFNNGGSFGGTRSAPSTGGGGGGGTRSAPTRR